jgi:hypothetical protein
MNLVRGALLFNIILVPRGTNIITSATRDLLLFFFNNCRGFFLLHFYRVFLWLYDRNLNWSLYHLGIGLLSLPLLGKLLDFGLQILNPFHLLIVFCLVFFDLIGIVLNDVELLLNIKVLLLDLQVGERLLILSRLKFFLKHFYLVPQTLKLLVLIPGVGALYDSFTCLNSLLEGESFPFNC